MNDLAKHYRALAALGCILCGKSARWTGFLPIDENHGIPYVLCKRCHQFEDVQETVKRSMMRRVAEAKQKPCTP